MFVSAHAHKRLQQRLGSVWAARIIAALERVNGEPDNAAIEVAVLPYVVYDNDGSNGDRVVVIARGGEVTTVMLRRSFDQPWTPEALSVDRVYAFGFPESGE